MTIIQEMRSKKQRPAITVFSSLLPCPRTTVMMACAERKNPSFRTAPGATAASRWTISGQRRLKRLDWPPSTCWIERFCHGKNAASSAQWWRRSIRTSGHYRSWNRTNTTTWWNTISTSSMRTGESRVSNPDLCFSGNRAGLDDQRGLEIALPA